MKIYFFTNQVDAQAGDIVSCLRRSGVIVLANQEHFSSLPKTELSLDRVQAVIIYGAQAQAAGYLVAAALSQKKPILYLLPKGNLFPEELRYLQSDRQLGQLFVVRFITQEKTQEVVYDFLELLETGELRQEKVSIKFTFRLSPRLERYLNWKSDREKMTKADWLRKFLVEEVIDQDEGWKKYIQSQNKTD